MTPRPSLGRVLAGLIRLVHPFPSLLDGAATAAIALVAGAEPSVAIQLGGAMVALQASIGALNDVLDATRKDAQPSPSDYTDDFTKGASDVGRETTQPNPTPDSRGISNLTQASGVIRIIFRLP